MALTFPSSPSNGQIYTDTVTGYRYSYNSSAGVWSFAANSVGMSVSSTPPSNVAPGAMWFNREIGRTFVYYDDGDSKQWIETVPAGAVDTNVVAGYVNPVFASMNTAYATANAVYNQSNTVYGVANAGFGKANTALQNTSGTFAGDLTITGNTIIGASSSYVHSGYFAVASSDNNGWAASFSSNSASGAASTGLVLGVRSGRAAIGGISGYDMSLCPDGGRVLKPNQPAWSGLTNSFSSSGTGGPNHRSGINWTYNGNLSGALRNVGNLWNTTTGRVTIPVSGYWLICAAAHKNNNNVDRTIGTISVNGSEYEFAECYGSYQDVGWAQVLYFAAGDWIECGRNAGLPVDTVDFSGYLLG